MKATVANAMTTTAPIVTGVDHLTIRVDDAHYDQLFELFTDTFQLPLAWPAAERYPGDAVGFKSGGIAAGQIDFEIFRVGAQPLADAQLYSIAFAAALSPAQCLQALGERAIPHLPLLAVPQDVFGGEGSLWTLVLLGDLFDPDLSALPALAPGSTGKSILAQRFDQAFADGMAFICAYNAANYDVAAQRARGQAALQGRGGGPLGYAGVHEIVVGVTNAPAARRQWQRFLAPVRPTRAAGWRRLLSPLHPADSVRWRFGAGPAIRLLPASRDGIVGLVWTVRSLDRARAFLHEQGMLGQSARRQIALAPDRVLGLDIRLIEE